MCKKPLGEECLEIHHMLLNCPMWKKEREQWLAPVTSFLRDIVEWGRGHFSPNDPDCMEGEIMATLLGGRYSHDHTKDNLTGFPNWQGGTNPALELLLYDRG